MLVRRLVPVGLPLLLYVSPSRVMLGACRYGRRLPAARMLTGASDRPEGLSDGKFSRLR